MGAVEGAGFDLEAQDERAAAVIARMMNFMSWILGVV
jgi:hypothetical protein